MFEVFLEGACLEVLETDLLFGFIKPGWDGLVEMDQSGRMDMAEM